MPLQMKLITMIHEYQENIEVYHAASSRQPGIRRIYARDAEMVVMLFWLIGLNARFSRMKAVSRRR
jgi:hypothetical protein